MTWDTFLTLRGTKGIYLDYVGTLRPSKSYGWVVANKILVTSPEANFGLFGAFGGFLGLFGALGFGLGLGLGLFNKKTESRRECSLFSVFIQCSEV